MSNFKAGDRVRMIDNGDNRSYGKYSKYVGLDAVVSRAADGFIDTTLVGGGNGALGAHFSRFELLSSTKGDYIIAVKSFGAYAPANPPRVFTSEKQALTVAEKMANEHGGTFVVFKAIAEAVLPKQLATVTKL